MPPKGERRERQTQSPQSSKAWGRKEKSILEGQDSKQDTTTTPANGCSALGADQIEEAADLVSQIINQGFLRHRGLW